MGARSARSRRALFPTGRAKSRFYLRVPPNLDPPTTHTHRETGRVPQPSPLTQAGLGTPRQGCDMGGHSSHFLVAGCLELSASYAASRSTTLLFAFARSSRASDSASYAASRSTTLLFAFARSSRASDRDIPFGPSGLPRAESYKLLRRAESLELYSFSADGYTWDSHGPRLTQLSSTRGAALPSNVNQCK